MADYMDYEELGQYLADMVDKLESQRKFAGDLEGTFTLPIEGGEEYIVTVIRNVPNPPSAKPSE